MDTTCARCGSPRHWTGSRWRCSSCYNKWQTERRQRLTPEQRARDAAVQAEYKKHRRTPAQMATYRSYQERWRAENAEYKRQQERTRYKANVEAMRAAKLAEYYRNPAPFLARNLLRKARLLAAVCEHGPKCVDTSFLQDIYALPCFYCKGITTDADHFQPLARGGLHCRENIVPACGPCNGSKKDRDPLEFLASRGLATN